LAPRLEEGNHTSDDRVEGAKDGDEDTAAVACAQACEGGSENNLGEKETIGKSRCQSVDVRLVPTALKSACI
jgi:hypothetical protein